MHPSHESLPAFAERIELEHARFSSVSIVAQRRPDGWWEVDLNGPCGPVLLASDLAFIYGSIVHRASQIDELLADPHLLSETVRGELGRTRARYIAFLDACEPVIECGTVRARVLGPQARNH